MRHPLSIAALSILFVLAWTDPADAGRKRPGARKARTTIKSSARRTAGPDAVRRDRSKVSNPTAEDRLREELEAIWAGRALRRGVTAIYVVDARTGEDIFSIRADDKLNPASNVKLLATATVLDLLGPDWRYLTRVFGPAPDAEGVARGSLYLRGNADPTFTVSNLDQLAASAAASGVRRIEGDVVLSDDLLRDTLSSPRISIKVTGGAAGKPPTVTVEPNTSYIQVHVDATTRKRRRPKVTVSTELIDAAAEPSAEGQSDPRLLIRVRGIAAAGKSQTFRRSVRLRSTFTGYLLRSVLRSAAVEVTGRVRLADFDAYSQEAAGAGWLPVELARHRSRPLDELVALTNKRSINWLADRLLMTAGSEAAGGGPLGMEHGLTAMRSWLARNGVDPDTLLVDTGSGLSRRTQLTTRHIVRVLRAAAGYTSKLSPRSLLDPARFVDSLAVGGIDGTLRGRFRGDSLRGQVFGKTGTLRDSVALSGFVSSGDDQICFSIVTNGNTWRSRGVVRREHEQMVVAMKRYLDARNSARALQAAAAVPQPAAADADGSAPPGEAEAEDSAP
jgi:D-alanyl-D-alanine carboxypeptidase/D-alanyl-D-alanine-endopeptidase (penicillin-binding protein 4)